ncbi:MAG TPA: Crp/Fnr family transcriptional regulator [Pyrinomonadaceae bacterium]|nr:Crp/Fnr family transcriptional regulator [Pyrinomonadaceae bacterium]
MNSATNLDVEEARAASQISCPSLLKDFVGFENVRLSSIYPRGAILFAEGQPAEGIYDLCSGRAKVSVSSSEGKKVILFIAQPGDLLGVNSVLNGIPQEVTVEALDRCRVDFISQTDFMNLLDRNKTACARVWLTLGKELSEVVDRVRSLLLSQSSEGKLARLLLEWSDDFGQPTPQGVRINHGLTQEEIAQMICASRETVSRLLTEMKRKEIVEFNGNGIFVRDRERLELIARL